LVTKESGIREYAVALVAARLGDLAYRVQSAAANPDADAVHDLRVAVRRFAQSLAVFKPLLPGEEVTRVRKRLRKVLVLAGEIRDRDIALEFLKEAGLYSQDKLWQKLASDRRRAEARLEGAVRQWQKSDFSAKWRSALQLSTR